jgi:hypothetical protein
MFYREAGQFKTNYVADQAVFPIRQDRIGIALDPACAFVAIPLFGDRLPAASGDDPVPHLSRWLRSGSISSPAIRAQLSLGTGAFMGVGAYACYKLTTDFPDVNIILWIVCRASSRPAIGVMFGLPSCASRVLSGDCHARRAVLPGMVLHPHWLARELQRLRRDRGAAAHARRHRGHRPEFDAAHALFRGADHRRADDVDRVQYRAAASAACGWRCATGHRGGAHGHPAAAHEASGLCRVVLSIAALPARCSCFSGTAARKPTPSTSIRASSCSSW